MKYIPPKAGSMLLRRILALVLLVAFAGVHIAHQHFQHSFGSDKSQISHAAGPRQQAEAIGYSQVANACPVCSLLGHLTLAKQSAATHLELRQTPSPLVGGYGIHIPCSILASLPAPRAPPANLA